MNIRPIRDGDEAPLADLWTRCGLVRPWNDPFSDIAFARATAQTEIFVGERDSAIIASVMCGHDGHRGWVYYLAVSPDCQGRDLGRAMMTQAEDHLRALDVPVLVAVGDEDAPCIDASVFLKRVLPSAGLWIAPRTGHCINLEESADFNARVLDFLTTVEQGRWRTPPGGGATSSLGVDAEDG